MSQDEDIAALAQLAFSKFRAAGRRIATAESCTGGMVAAALTAIPGSSDVFERGFVTYSNAAKCEMLGVPLDLIERHGAVSAEVATAMARGAIQHSRADIAVAVTGIAGPGGGSAAKPVGLVYVAVAHRAATARVREFRFADQGRWFVRTESVKAALHSLNEG
jgi:nicotinamide-nucleotide amidase